MCDYKTIGNTVAKVVSILAVSGGLLWWQRASTSYPAPHPQDEAVIMHSILERHYAQGRTNTQFTSTYPANVSQIISGNTSNLVVPAGSVLHADYPSDSYIVGSSYSGDFYTDEWDWNSAYGYCSYTPSIPSPGIYYWYADGTSPWTLLPYGDSGVTSGPSIHAETVIYTNAAVYSYVTNGPEHVDTNTVGVFPNATYQYPAQIRSALSSGFGHWVLPPDSYMATGSDPGFITNFPTRHLDSDPDWWTNLVTRSTNTVDVNAGKLFAFERDNKALLWSINAYNDMARALSLMQWQESQQSLSADYTTWDVTLVSVFSGDGTLPTDHGGCSNFVTVANLGKLSPVFIFQGYLDYSLAYAINAGHGAPAVEMNGSWFADTYIPFSDPRRYSGYVHCHTWIQGASSLFTNTTCFSLTNIALCLTNNGSAWSISQKDPPQPYLDMAKNGAVIATTNVGVLPGAGLAFMDFSTNTLFPSAIAAMYNTVDDVIAKTQLDIESIASTNGPSTQFKYYYHGYAPYYPDVGAYSNSARNLPYTQGSAVPLFTFRVQLESLTDYTKHTPVR